ncbi:MAG: PorV/PorQ family protein [Ignavibacteria bacterium]|nr:PorV/PorQ family protein [Ignavibacteria bacterium]
MKTANQVFYILVTALLLWAVPATAQKVGSTSMQYLSVIPGARAAGMGNAYSAIAYGVDGVFWNPAGVALTEGQQFSTAFIKWIFDTRQFALAYSLSLSDYGAVGLQLQYNDYGTFEEAKAVTGLGSDYYPGQEFPYLTGRTFKPYSYIVGLTYASRLTDHFSTGITVKYTHESLYDQDQIPIIDRTDTTNQSNVNTYGSVVLFDFGVHYNTGFRTVQVGASVQNFGPDVIYAKDKSPVPMLFRIGMAADLIGENSLLLEDESNRLGVAFDIFQSNDYDQQQHLGIEYEFAKTIALRAGYKVNYDVEGFTFGGGIKHKIASFKFSFDYAYGAMGSYVGAFGNVHRISVGVGIL